MNARPDPVLVAALLALTFSTGIIDAVSFLALGQVFTANMTGNVALLGFAVFSPDLSLPRSLTALAVFVLGAMAGGRLVVSAALAPGRRWIVAALAGEAVLLLACAIAARGEASPVEAPRLAYLLIALLAFAMGVRNATVRRIGLRDLPTTVVTSSLADLGMTIAVRGGRSPWKRAVASAVLMLVGAGAGALMLRVSVAFALAASAVIAAVCAAALAVRHDAAELPAPQE
jgi:uncharacterized membrane protein YoaK (UPF0700 family)